MESECVDALTVQILSAIVFSTLVVVIYIPKFVDELLGISLDIQMALDIVSAILSISRMLME